MAGYVNPEDIEQDLNNPFNRAMGLAVAIANNKNIALDMERFDDPMYEPSETLVYISGKSGVAGAEKPEKFENIEKYSNADMGDAIITYNGNQFSPSALVVHKTWITRHYNGRWESAVADFTKVDSQGKIDPEQWDWIDQGFGIEDAQEDPVFDEGEGELTNRVSNFNISAGGYTAEINGDSLVVDLQECRGPVTSSLFSHGNKGFSIKCDLVTAEFGCDYSLFYTTAGESRCAGANLVWELDDQIGINSIFKNVGVEDFEDIRKVLYNASYYNIQIGPIRGFKYDWTDCRIEIGTYPSDNDLTMIGISGGIDSWAVNLAFGGSPNEYNCFASVPNGHLPKGEYVVNDLQIFPAIINKINEPLEYYSNTFISFRLQGMTEEEGLDCSGTVYLSAKFIPTIFILTTDIIENAEDSTTSMGTWTTINDERT